jgi:hypothetical protein
MNIKFGKIEVDVKEVFFYDPNKKITNICTMCDRKDCPVNCKDIVTNCNSYTLTEKPVITDWMITQEMIIPNNNHAYVINCTD